jgi:hypothetical protein
MRHDEGVAAAAIPPAYTEYIGNYLLKAVQS